jgi:heat shock protein HtpX
MNTLKTTLLLATLTGLMLVIGLALGGRGGMTVALLVAAVMNFSALFFSDKIVLRAYRARPVAPEEAPRFYEVVGRLAAKADIPMPRLYVIPDAALNAFATGRSPSHAAVAVTEGLLRALSAEELEGVLAHELSHVLNRDTLTSTVAATLAGAITWLAHPFMLMGMGGSRRRDDGGNPLIALVLVLVAPLVAALVKAAISRSREYEADATGAQLVGYPHGLVGALRKLQQAQEVVPMRNADPATAHLFIVNPLSAGGLLSFNTHPPLEDRIQRLLSRDR